MPTVQSRFGSTRRGLLLFACLVGAVLAGVAPVWAARALVLNGSVLLGDASAEVGYLTALGYQVDLLPTASTPWPTTPAEFSVYDLIFIGDNEGWTNPVDLTPAIATALVWGPMIDGNAIVVGGRANYAVGPVQPNLMRAAIDFAAAQPGRRGFCCISTNSNPASMPSGTPLPVLAGLGAGGFRGFSCRAFELHKSLDHPALTRLSDFYLSFALSAVGQTAGAWTAFESWPPDFQVVALIGDLYGFNYTGADGVSGWPFILARGAGLTPVPALEFAEADWWQDAFPFNEDPALPGTTAFDSTSALVKSGRNTMLMSDDALHGYWGDYRHDIPGDSLVVCTCDDDLRLDLVFRILPGPGNYKPTPRPHMAPGGEPVGELLRLPTDTVQVVVPGDASFWGQYLSNPGEFGSPGGHHAGTRWDPDTWNSARMDTAEINLFPVEGRGNLTRANPCVWSATLHESDPKFSVLGVVKHRCFLVDPAQRPAAANLTCTSEPSWLFGPGVGYDSSPLTRELTKIIPDGLLTPGSHVEYFIRRSHVSNPGVFTALPDTNRVVPQNSTFAASTGFCSGRVPFVDLDGHRWQEFSVLPDRWKATEYGGEGAACMLHVDIANGSGDESDWVACADLLGATSAAKWGAHNGWHIPALTADPNEPQHFVRHHAGQAGSTWDLYSVQKAHFGSVADTVPGTIAMWWNESTRGFAGSIGSRYSQAIPWPSLAGRTARVGPTKEMLRAYYRMLYATGGDAEFDLLGPHDFRSQDDAGILVDFLAAPGGTAQPRGILVQGDAVATALFRESFDWPTHNQLLTRYFGTDLRSIDYREISSNTTACPALSVSFPSGAGGSYALEAVLRPAHDVVQSSPVSPGAAPLVAATYPPYGPNAPYAASIHGLASLPARNWISWFDAFRLRSVVNAECGGVSDRRHYMSQVLGGVFADVCAVAPAGEGQVDVPLTARPSDDFRVLSNPSRAGEVRFELRLSRGGPTTVLVTDLAGRRVRALEFDARPGALHRLSWDTRDDRGERCPAGVYFAQPRGSGVASRRSRSIVLVR